MCELSEGSIFYGETRRRVRISLDREMRLKVEQCFKEMHDLYDRGYTPFVKRTKGCNACSLKDLCLPELANSGSVKCYIDERLK